MDPLWLRWANLGIRTVSQQLIQSHMRLQRSISDAVLKLGNRDRIFYSYYSFKGCSCELSLSWRLVVCSFIVSENNKCCDCTFIQYGNKCLFKFLNAVNERDAPTAQLILTAELCWQLCFKVFTVLIFRWAFDLHNAWANKVMRKRNIKHN